MIEKLKGSDKPCLWVGQNLNFDDSYIGNLRPTGFGVLLRMQAYIIKCYLDPAGICKK